MYNVDYDSDLNHWLAQNTETLESACGPDPVTALIRLVEWEKANG